jgi:hypothetical protein
MKTGTNGHKNVMDCMFSGANTSRLLSWERGREWDESR